MPVAKIYDCFAKEAVEKITENLNIIEQRMSEGKDKEAVKHMKKTVALLQVQIGEMTKAEEKFRRNMYEVAKLRTINATVQEPQPLQTCAYKAGDVMKVRQPTRKKQRAKK